MTDSKSTTDFVVRLAARFLKDPAISSDAKALCAVLGAYADGRTGWYRFAAELHPALPLPFSGTCPSRRGTIARDSC